MHRGRMGLVRPYSAWSRLALHRPVVENLRASITTCSPQGQDLCTTLLQRLPTMHVRQCECISDSGNRPVVTVGTQNPRSTHTWVAHAQHTTPRNSPSSLEMRSLPTCSVFYPNIPNCSCSRKKTHSKFSSLICSLGETLRPFGFTQQGLCHMRSSLVPVLFRQDSIPREQTWSSYCLHSNVNFLAIRLLCAPVFPPL